jgi:hypothetical protein
VTDDIDVRPVPPPWHQLYDLVDGARQRGWTSDAQLDYLRAVIGVTYAKGFRAGQQSMQPEPDTVRSPFRAGGRAR